MHYLRSSNEIKRRLGDLFSGAGQKWAIVGFVGYNALDHLPSGVSDLSVVCWPKAGGTNPDGVRRLIDRGVTVYFCDRLHQKIYWRKGGGLIIGSANLSDNALGEGGLHEFGVYCDDKDFDIDSVLSALNYKNVTQRALAKLDVQHAAQARKNRNALKDNFKVTPTFLAATKSGLAKRFKLLHWIEYRIRNDHIKAAVESHSGASSWVSDNDIDSSKFRDGDFVLQIKTNGDYIERANAQWLLVDCVVEKRGNRAVVQIEKLDGRTPPPFVIDATFKKFLKEAFNTTAWGNVCNDDCVVTTEFIDKIRDLHKAKN